MEFTLVYQGRVPANGSPKEKQKIRRIFHSQLKELFKHTPYNLDPPPSRSIRRVGNYTFSLSLRKGVEKSLNSIL